MSRIGNLPIPIPEGVTVKNTGGSILVSGPKGELNLAEIPGILMDIKDQVVEVKRKSEEKKLKALHGLTRSKVSNMIHGVTEGWSKNLELVGVGYRAETNGSKLRLNIGFSHPVEVLAPEGVQFEVKDNTKITVSGIDKEKVGEMSAKIRNIRPPEPYKGKGIRYEDERVRRKAGKVGVAIGGK